MKIENNHDVDLLALVNALKPLIPVLVRCFQTDVKVRVGLLGSQVDDVKLGVYVDQSPILVYYGQCGDSLVDKLVKSFYYRSLLIGDLTK